MKLFLLTLLCLSYSAAAQPVPSGRPTIILPPAGGEVEIRLPDGDDRTVVLTADKVKALQDILAGAPEVPDISRILRDIGPQSNTVDAPPAPPKGTPSLTPSTVTISRAAQEQWSLNYRNQLSQLARALLDVITAERLYPEYEAEERVQLKKAQPVADEAIWEINPRLAFLLHNARERASKLGK